MEVEMQPEAELEYSSIISIDFPPVDPIVAAAGFAFAFASATASNPPLHTARLGFSDAVSVVLSPLDTPPLPAPGAAPKSLPRALVDHGTAMLLVRCQTCSLIMPD
jgi:hypothetical protein